MCMGLGLVAGDPGIETRRVHGKTHEEHNLTQIYLNLIVFNYIFTLLQAAAYFIAHCGVAYVVYLRCRLRRHQTAQIPPMRRSNTVQWRRRPAPNSAQG